MCCVDIALLLCRLNKMAHFLLLACFRNICHIMCCDVPLDQLKWINTKEWLCLLACNHLVGWFDTDPPLWANEACWTGSAVGLASIAGRKHESGLCTTTTTTTATTTHNHWSNYIRAIMKTGCHKKQDLKIQSLIMITTFIKSRYNKLLNPQVKPT